MGMQIGIVGKPNVGKSTFFSAATEVDVGIASYPFTTIDANIGVTYVRYPCPCKEFNVSCNPNNSKCVGGIRFIPIEVIDVAGLVPGAHEGRGLGNKFLDDLRQADAFIHIVDASGSTDDEGRACEKGSHDPLRDVEFLEEEICYWFAGILKKDWNRIARQCEVGKIKFERMLADKLAGLKIREFEIHRAITNLQLDPEKPSRWSEEDILSFAFELRRISKPMLIALNKCDLLDKCEMDELMARLKEKGYIGVPTSAEAELALRRASKSGLIDYVPGSPDFKILSDLDDRRRKALEFIREKVLSVYGSTGVQECIERVAFDLLNLIVVYPVEDENHLTDKQGRVLPDAYLMPKGSTARDLAYKIHTDLGEGFIKAIDARTHRVLGADYELKSGDIIKVVARS